MKTQFSFKSFIIGSLLTSLVIFGIAAASKNLIGPTSATTANAIATWTDTSAFKLKNTGVTVTDPGTVSYAQGVPNFINLGTISNGNTATLLGTNNQYYATFSGATATIALPASPANGVWIIHGTTTYNSGEQIITVPSLIRPEQSPSTAITTFTNASTANGLFTVAFTAVGGNFVKFSVVGDNL